MDIHLILLSCIPMSHNLVCCTNWFHFGHLISSLLVALISLWQITTVLVFETFFTFWHCKIFQACSVYFLPQSQNQTSLQGAGSLTGESFHKSSATRFLLLLRLVSTMQGRYWLVNFLDAHHYSITPSKNANISICSSTNKESINSHQLNGHEFEQALGDGEGQGSLACCSP